jgi:hypothetical protein
LGWLAGGWLDGWMDGWMAILKEICFYSMGEELSQRMEWVNKTCFKGLVCKVQEAQKTTLSMFSEFFNNVQYL